MGRGTAAGRYEHVDECVLPSGVVTGKQDRVRISDDTEVREAVVLIRSSDREVSLRVVGSIADFGVTVELSFIVCSLQGISACCALPRR